MKTINILLKTLDTIVFTALDYWMFIIPLILAYFLYGGLR